MIHWLWFVLPCTVVALLLAALPNGRVALAQGAAQSPSDAVALIRAEHQVEDLRRLLDLAHERGQNIVVRLEPAPAGAVSGGRARLCPRQRCGRAAGLGSSGAAGHPRL
jgi:hypothetical protein